MGSPNDLGWFAGVVTGDAARERQETPARPPVGIQGNSGKPLGAGGRVYGYERNARLADQLLIRDLAHFVRSSPAMFAPWWFTRSAWLSGTTTVEPAKDGSREPADYLEEAFGLGSFASRGRAQRGFEAYLADFLWAPFYGFGVHEEEWYAADGRDWLADWHYREPESINEWRTDEAERLVAVIQRPVGGWSSGARVIDANRILHLSHMRTGANWRGIGIGRVCHPHAADLDLLYRLMAAGAQRWGIGTPHAKINEMEVRQAHPAATKADFELLAANVAAQLKAYTSHELGHLVSGVGVHIEVVGGDHDPSGLIAQAQHHWWAISSAWMAQFLQLGSQGSSGSWSLGDVQKTTAERALVNTLEWIYGEINGPGRPGAGTVGRMLQFNFGDQLKPREYPRIWFEGIRVDDFIEQVSTLPGLQSAGLVTWQDADERKLRRGLGMAELDSTSARPPDSRRTGRPSRVSGASLFDQARGGGQQKLPLDEGGEG